MVPPKHCRKKENLRGQSLMTNVEVPKHLQTPKHTMAKGLHILGRHKRDIVLPLFLSSIPKIDVARKRNLRAFCPVIVKGNQGDHVAAKGKAGSTGSCKEDKRRTARIPLYEERVGLGGGGFESLDP